MLHVPLARRAVPGAVLLTAALLLPCCTRDAAPRPSTAARADFRLLVQQPAAPGAAVATATQRCLTAHGFTAPPPNPLVGSVANLPPPLDEAAARTRGYGHAILRGPDRTADPVTRYAQSLPPADRARLDTVLDPGTPQVRFTTPAGWRVEASSAGCVAEARAAVYGSVRDWLVAFYLPQDLNRVAAGVVDDPAVRRAEHAYRQCMATAGLTTAWPQDALTHAGKASAPSDDPHQPTAAETRLATADAHCRVHSRLATTMTSVFEARSAEWLDAHQPLVRHAAAAIRAAGRHAASPH